MRVEGLLAAFPKLLSHSKSQHHTFVETDSVRYVYQPLENQMYVLLITNKASNIVEDLGTLRLLAKLVPDVAGGLNENSIQQNAFELIFAFDELLTAGNGYREEVTLSNIQNNLVMDSHEEKMQLMIEEKKKEAAKKAMEEKAKEIKSRQMEQMKQNFLGDPTGTMKKSMGGMQGFGGGGMPNQGLFDGFNADSNMNNNMMNSRTSAMTTSTSKSSFADDTPRVVAKGMKLGVSGETKKKENIMAAIGAEDNLSLMMGGTKKKGVSGDVLGLGTSSQPTSTPSSPLSILLEEKISVAMNREGGIESSEVKGMLTLTANTEVGSNAVVSVNKSVLASQCSSSKNWTFSTHPKVDKTSYEKTGVLNLKGGGGLPVARPVGVLRWSYNGEDSCPLTINCWPEEDGSGSIIVNIEYELKRDMTLHNVTIMVPLGTSDTPSIQSIDGQYKVDAQRGVFSWYHDVIDRKNPSGSVEFSIDGSDVGVFFPVQVMFASQSLFCPIDVTSVTSSSSGSPLPNALTKSVTPESYQVV
jgi:hypothetical protein